MVSDVQLNEFEELGYTLIDNVFTEDEMNAAAVAIDDIHKDTPRFIGNIDDERLLFLMHDKRMEAIAKSTLEADDVVVTGCTSLYRSPGDVDWNVENEHVDIMFSMNERRARPKEMLCMIMVFIDDLPEGRSNTFVRPGSHLQMSRYLEEKNEEPYRVAPTYFKDLPKLDWAEPVPVVAKKGQALAFNTSLIHGGSTNITDQPRRMTFSNFCANGIMASIAGNHNTLDKQEDYRVRLRDVFPKDRLHLLENSYFAK